jgi:hypothetical protein
MLLGKFTVVGSTKDLNPASLIDLNRISGALVHRAVPNRRRKGESLPLAAATAVAAHELISSRSARLQGDRL